MIWKTKTIVGVVFIGLILMQFLYDPLAFLKQNIDVGNIQTQLVNAQAQWDSVMIQNYTFEIYGASQSICAVNAIIEVQDDTVIKVHPVNTVSPLPPEKWDDPDWGNEVFLCDYNHFTISQMFAMLEKTLANSPFAVLEAEFDPQYGFITRFEDGLFASHGWLNLRDKNVYNEFQVSNFKIEP